MHAIQAVGLCIIMTIAVLASQTSAGEMAQQALTLQIDQIWAGRTPPMAQVEQGSHGGELSPADQSAVYMTVHNRGTEPEVLLAARSAIATGVVFHDTLWRDGTMVMHPRTTFSIPAGGQLEMRPGKAHLMLLGLQQALRRGDTVPLTLTFQRAGQLAIEVPVP